MTQTLHTPSWSEPDQPETALSPFKRFAALPDAAGLYNPEQEKDACGLAIIATLRGELLRAHGQRRARHDVGDEQRAHIANALDQTAQIAFGEHARQPARGIQDGGHAHLLVRDLVQRLRARPQRRLERGAPASRRRGGRGPGNASSNPGWPVRERAPRGRQGHGVARGAASSRRRSRGQLDCAPGRRLSASRCWRLRTSVSRARAGRSMRE